MKLLKNEQQNEISVVKHGEMSTESAAGMETDFVACPECFEILSDAHIIRTESNVKEEKRLYEESYELNHFQCPHCKCEFVQKKLKKRSLSRKKIKTAAFICSLLVSAVCFFSSFFMPSKDANKIFFCYELSSVFFFVGVIGLMFIFRKRNR